MKVVVPEILQDESERPFYEDEVRRLLTGKCMEHLKDLMMIGALTGARLDAIVDLRVRHCLDGYFTFKAQKREKAARDIPIHSALKDMVERRTAGKDPDDWFFPEYPPPKKVGSLKEHSSQATKAFTLYRRKIGVNPADPRQAPVTGQIPFVPPLVHHEGRASGAARQHYQGRGWTQAPRRNALQVFGGARDASSTQGGRVGQAAAS